MFHFFLKTQNIYDVEKYSLMLRFFTLCLMVQQIFTNVISEKAILICIIIHWFKAQEIRNDH